GGAGSGLEDGYVVQLRESPDATGVAEPQFGGDVPARGVVFAKPELVCEVRYTEVTSQGMLRHPVFVGLLAGVSLEECVAPAEVRGASEPPPAPEPAAKPAKREQDDGQPRLTRLEKVF